MSAADGTEGVAWVREGNLPKHRCARVLRGVVLLNNVFRVQRVRVSFVRTIRAKENRLWTEQGRCRCVDQICVALLVVLLSRCRCELTALCVRASVCLCEL